MTIKKSIVELVIQRAAGYCEKCGGPASESMALHHRKLKSRGGKDAVANLMWVHHGCHNMASDSIHANPALAADKGWMVSSWDEPENAPLVLPGGRVVLLQENGKITVPKGGKI
jgi:hypothetical protein